MEIPEKFKIGDEPTVYGHPDAACLRALRFRPQHSPLSVAQVTGLVQLLMEVRNRLGSGPLKMVELGSYSGESASIWAGSRLFDEITLIDIWANQRAMGLCDYRMRRFPEVKMLRSDGILAAQNFEDESLDYLYLDADHSEDFTVNCLNAWYPKVKKGGIFAGHDWNRTSWPGVCDGVLDFFNLSEDPQLFDDSSWMIPKA